LFEISSTSRAAFKSTTSQGRSEGYLIGRTELAATIDRLVAYADAGADCLYAPEITDLLAIRTLVSAVAPKHARC
jgi:2-methylisocitrate lyase-like PEP mutase family enzyme